MDNRAHFWKDVFTSESCHNKVSKTGWLIAMKIYCLRLLDFCNPILDVLARLLSSGGSTGESVLSPSLRRLSATLSILGL